MLGRKGRWARRIAEARTRSGSVVKGVLRVLESAAHDDARDDDARADDAALIEAAQSPLGRSEPVSVGSPKRRTALHAAHDLSAALRNPQHPPPAFAHPPFFPWFVLIRAPQRP